MSVSSVSPGSSPNPSNSSQQMPQNQYNALVAQAQALGITTIPSASNPNAVAALQQAVSQAQSNKNAQNNQQQHHHGGGQKMAEYQSLASQAKSLGIKNIPQPQKGQKGSLDRAISSLQSQISQAQSKQQSGSSNQNNNPNFSAPNVGLGASLSSNTSTGQRLFTYS
jgi:hypothetical protein